jgi:uncharacterized protein involved in type VI secretion and phage assembly
MKYKVTVEKTQTCSGIVEVEAGGPVAAQEAVDRDIESGTLQTTAVNWDDPDYNDGSFKTTGDIEEV